MELRNKKIFVFGLNDEGIATVLALKALGASVKAFDIGFREDWKQKASQELKHLSKQIFFGENFPEESIGQTDLVVLSGARGVYDGWLVPFLEQEIPIQSPLDLASKIFPQPIIGVTGTNGKSSVAKMTELMLTQSGKSAFLAGGNFAPYLQFVNARKKFDVAVFEVSSSSLEESSFFKPHVAIITNIVPAHFDRHNSFFDYIAAKTKIFELQDEKDLFIYNAENPHVVNLVPKAKSHPFPIYLSNPKRLSKEINECAYYEGKNLYYCLPDEPPELYSLERKKIKGAHQTMNLLCALAAARHLGASFQAIQSVIDNFSGLSHRMQRCFEKNGLVFYDDSYSSNPASTAWGLTQFNKPVILIAGGLDRGADYRKLSPYIQKKVKLLFLIGEGRRKMFQTLKNLTDTYLVGTLEEAVHLACQKSQRGDRIVFSPAALPEPHLFAGYEGRGQKYLEILNKEFEVELEKKRRTDVIQRGGIKI